MAEIVGWLILFFSYFLIFSNREAKKNSSVCAVLLVALSLHHLIAITNAYIITTIGASNDADTFHRLAVSITENKYPYIFGSGPHFYRLMLAFFYKLFGVSLFLGNELSVFAFLVSCFVFIKIYKLLGTEKYLGFWLLLYGCLPSMVFFGSITLREPWQILCFMLMLYFCLKNLINGNITNAIYFVIFSTIFSLFHEAFLLLVLLIAVCMIIFHFIPFSNKKLRFFSSRLPTIIFITITSMTIMFGLHKNINKTPELAYFHSISKGESIKFIKDFRDNAMQYQGRTSFGNRIDPSSLQHLAISFIPAFTYFMFAPFPWQIRNMMDLYAGIESFLRFSLLILALLTCYFIPAPQKRPGIFLLTVYLILSALWTLGTLNYGTSIRHHIVGYWILLLICSIGFEHLFRNRLQIKST